MSKTGIKIISVISIALQLFTSIKLVDVSALSQEADIKNVYMQSKSNGKTLGNKISGITIQQETIYKPILLSNATSGQAISNEQVTTYSAVTTPQVSTTPQAITTKQAVDKSNPVTSVASTIENLPIVTEIEPNNTFREAQSIEMCQVDGKLSKGNGMIETMVQSNHVNDNIPSEVLVPPGNSTIQTDVDYFSVMLDASQEYSFRLKNKSMPAKLNIDLHVCSKLVTFPATISRTVSSTKAIGIEEQIDFRPAISRVYYIEVVVSSDSPSATDDYELIINRKSSGEAYEPNNSLETAKEIIPEKDYEAKIDAATDENWYKVTVTNSRKMYLNLLKISQGRHLDITIYNDTKQILKNCSTSGDTDEKLSLVFPSDGTYYIKVFSEYGFNITLNYLLNYSLRNSDQFEPNDDIENARNIELTTKIQGSVDSLFDVDYYSFTLKSKSDIVINLNCIPDECDYDLYLLDSLGQPIGSSNNRQSMSEIINGNLDAGTYYVKIDSYQNYSENKLYSLMVRLPVGVPEEVGDHKINNSAQNENFNIFVKTESNTKILAEVGGANVLSNSDFVNPTNGVAMLSIDIQKLKMGDNLIIVKAIDDMLNSSLSLEIKVKREPQESTYNIQCIPNKKNIIAFSGKNIKNITNIEFVFEYNKDDLEICDLCSLTSQIDMGVGLIKGTNIKIISFQPGQVVFRIDRSAPANKSWTSILNLIKVKTIKQQGTTTVKLFKRAIGISN